MNHRLEWRAATNQEVDQYLNLETSSSRIRLLESWQKNRIGLPVYVIRAILSLNVPDEEVTIAFETCVVKNKPDFELWIMNNFLMWNQNIAAASLRAWSAHTDRILWHRLIPVLAIPELPQRIRYTIVELAPASHGFEIVRAAVASYGWEELSPAFQAMLFERALQFDIKSDRLISLAKKILSHLATVPHPEHKALFAAYAYLIRHNEITNTSTQSNHGEFIWSEFIKSSHEHHNRRKGSFSRLEKFSSKSSTNFDVINKLPPIWSRFDAPMEILVNILNQENPSFSSLAGFDRQAICEAVKISNPHYAWHETLANHLPLNLVNHHEKPTKGHLPNSYNQVKFPILAEARIKASKGQSAITNDTVTRIEQFCDITPNETQQADHPISAWLAAVRGEEISSNDSENIWNNLANAFRKPDDANLVSLSTLSRKQKGLAHLGFIILLSRLKGRDDAVLKLLDYIRSNEESQLRAVVRALGMINTSRSHLELIAMLTRPNSTLSVQQEIVAILAKKDLNDLQKELRSAIQDLKPAHNPDHPLNQIIDELSALLAPISEITEAVSKTSLPNSAFDNINLDQELSGTIPQYNSLSSEVKRALRTALFFDKTAASSEHADSIDLSPLIDMQYKAMELLYREFFEDMVSHSLQNGSIQRKLDVIGYARPIVRQMDDFEGYIASLPIVRDIPFFSKFKLRKMLRAICQFEPGRRFTLDGLKAFGLYFLIFGRQSCNAGLANTVFVGTSNDQELAEFCKELHVFQDFRNRAAHEGFHPDASNDIQGIWRTTVSLVTWAFKIKDAQKSITAAKSKKAS